MSGARLCNFGSSDVQPATNAQPTTDDRRKRQRIAATPGQTIPVEDRQKTPDTEGADYSNARMESKSFLECGGSTPLCMGEKQSKVVSSHRTPYHASRGVN